MSVECACSAQGRPYLGDAQCSPLFFPQQLQCASSAVKIVFGDDLQHLLGQLHVAVLELIVRVSVVMLLTARRQGL